MAIFLSLVPAQEKEDPSNPASKPLNEIRAELETMFKTDQSLRKECMEKEKKFGRDSKEVHDLWEKQIEIDKNNIKRLEAIIAEHGWPGRTQFGENAAMAAFLVLQHADYKYQKKYLPMVRKAVKEKECDPSNLALLEDRVLMREGKPQIYGSQVVQDAETGGFKVYQIKDEANVDERRAAVGLPPLKEYLAIFGIEYQAPQGSNDKPVPAPQQKPRKTGGENAPSK
ncbi:MAG: DUF6624 domain-containing protein [Planctomycetota bacterium]